MIKSMLTEYGPRWVFNRSLYSLKLKVLKNVQHAENFFERDPNIMRTDIFGINTEELEIFLRALPESKKINIIQSANNAIEGKIKGFSSIKLDYGFPINWHLNPLTNQTEDSDKKWFKIPDFDNVRGDIKLIWEISRFTHFYLFTRAYMLTKDVKFYEAFSNQLNEWLNNNPYSYGANYKCGQEASLRMINILSAHAVFTSYGLTNISDAANVKKIVRDSYKKVKSNFFYAHKCIKNNHTLSEITGLIIGSWASEDDLSLKNAYKLMNEEIEKQFLKDGGYLQYSFNYQRFALQLMELILKISNKTGLEINQKNKLRILNSSKLLYQIETDKGKLPNYGSNDGALIFPVTVCDYLDYRPVINTIHTLISGERLYPSGYYDEELIWFSEKNLKNMPLKDKEKESAAFHEAGFYVLRKNDSMAMVVLQDFKTRPAQMDQLHLDLWHKGINIFCDSGTYSYATNLGKSLSLTSAHNTMKIVEKEQMNKSGPFFIYDWSQAGIIRYDRHSFIGVMKSKNDYIHQRKVILKSKEIIVKDKLIGSKEDFEILYHTPCQIVMTEYGLDLINEDNLIAKIHTNGKFDVKKTYRSLYYYKKEEINCITVKPHNTQNELVVEVELI